MEFWILFSKLNGTIVDYETKKIFGSIEQFTGAKHTGTHLLIRFMRLTAMANS